MGKYIIELPDDEYLISWWIYTGTEDGKQHIDFHEVVKTPYKEPDPEAIKQEAYQRGLAEAWEAARKIAKLNTDEQKRLFGCFGIYFVAHEFSAHEAIEKIRQYEQEQKEIQVGDEVAFHHDDGRPDTVVVVTYIGPDGFIDGMDGRGTQYAHKNPKKWTKTGRRFPEIAEVLKKMGEKE